MTAPRLTPPSAITVAGSMGHKRILLGTRLFADTLHVRHDLACGEVAGVDTIEIEPSLTGFDVGVPVDRRWSLTIFCGAPGPS